MADLTFNFDRLDYDILCILHENARIPASSIANQLNVDVRTVNKRISRMLESGAVRTSVVIDPSDFGYPCIVEIYLETEANKFKEYTQKFVDDPRIPYVAVQWDKNQLELQGRFRTNEEMHDFVNNELPFWPGVTVKSCSLVPVILKNIDSWFPGEPAFSEDKAK